MVLLQESRLEESQDYALPTPRRGLIRFFRVCVIGLFAFAFVPAATYVGLTALFDKEQWRLAMMLFAVEVPVIGGLFLVALPWKAYHPVHRSLCRWNENGELSPEELAGLHAQTLRLPSKVATAVVAGTSVGFAIAAWMLATVGQQPPIEVAKIIPAIVLVGGLCGAFCFFGIGRALHPIAVFCSQRLAKVTLERRIPLSTKFLATTYIIVLSTLCLLHPSTYTLAQVMIEEHLQNLALAQLRLTGQRVGPVMLSWNQALSGRYAALRAVFRGAQVGPRGYVFAVDDQGNILTPHPLAYQQLSQEQFAHSWNSPKSYEYSWVERRGEHRVVAMLRLATPPWTLFSVSYPSDFAAPLNHYVQFSLIPIAVVGLIVVLFGNYFTNGITTPLAELMTVTQRIAEKGELQSHVPVATNDELADVASSFNRMVDELRVSQERVTHHASEVERTAQALAELNKEMEDVLRVVSHDLRAPLINIQGFSNRLSRSLRDLQARVEVIVREGKSEQSELALKELQGTIGPKLEESLKFIGKGVEQMDSLLSQLLAISRIGRKSEPMEPQDLNRILDDVLATFDHQLHERRIQVSRHPLPSNVPCRKNEIRQVFANLLSNSINYMGDCAEPKIEIGGVGRADQIECYVRDTGIGIAPADHDRIFQAFTRLEVLAVPGEGVGLAFVKRVIRSHGGRIWVDSSMGMGSTFHFTLPLGQPK